MYAKIVGGEVSQYPYTVAMLRDANPNVSFPGAPTDELLLGYGVVRVVVTGRPVHDSATQVATEVAPSLTGGVWHQTWQVVDKTPEDIAAELTLARSRMSITPRQARLALLGAGLLPQIEAAIQALTEPDRSAVLIEWEYASDVQRTHAWVVALCAQLGLTDAQLDGLFVQGALL